MNQNPLTQQIAASLEDVKALLADNRSLSIAFLSRRIRDLEEEMRERFRALPDLSGQLDSLEKSIKALEDRVTMAAVKYREMREDIDRLGRGNGHSAGT